MIYSHRLNELCCIFKLILENFQLKLNIFGDKKNLNLFHKNFKMNYIRLPQTIYIPKLVHCSLQKMWLIKKSCLSCWCSGCGYTGTDFNSRVGRRQDQQTRVTSNSSLMRTELRAVTSPYTNIQGNIWFQAINWLPAAMCCGSEACLFIGKLWIQLNVNDEKFS